MAFLDQIYIIMRSNTYSYAGNIFWKVIVSSFCHHPHRKQSNHGVNSHFPVVSMLSFLARKQWQKPVVLAPRRPSRTLTYLREAWTTYGDLIWKKKCLKYIYFLGTGEKVEWVWALCCWGRVGSDPSTHIGEITLHTAPALGDLTTLRASECIYTCVHMPAHMHAHIHTNTIKINL